MFTLADLKRGSGKQNMGGLLTKAYYFPVDHLDPEEDLPQLSAAGKLDTVGNFVFLTGKKMIEVYCTPEKNKLDSNSVGEVDGMSKENLYDCFYPGNDQEVAEFEAFALNTPAMLIIPDTNGNNRIVGLCRLDSTTTVTSKDLEAHLVSSNTTSGGARADLRGTTFQFKAAAPHAPLFYKGTMQLVAAS